MAPKLGVRASALRLGQEVRKLRDTNELLKTALAFSHPNSTRSVGHDCLYRWSIVIVSQPGFICAPLNNEPEGGSCLHAGIARRRSLPRQLARSGTANWSRLLARFTPRTMGCMGFVGCGMSSRAKASCLPSQQNAAKYYSKQQTKLGYFSTVADKWLKR